MNYQISRDKALEQLIARSSGELSPIKRYILERHLDKCWECTTEASKFDLLPDQLHTLQFSTTQRSLPPAVEKFKQELAQRIKERQYRRKTYKILLLIAISGTLIAGFAYYLSRLPFDMAWSIVISGFGAGGIMALGIVAIHILNQILITIGQTLAELPQEQISHFKSRIRGALLLRANSSRKEENDNNTSPATPRKINPGKEESDNNTLPVTQPRRYA